MQLFAALHEDVVGLLRLWIRLTHDVINVGEDRMRTPVILQMAEVNGPVDQQDGLVWRREDHSRFSIVGHHVVHGSRRYQQACQNPDNLHNANSALVFAHRPPFDRIYGWRAMRQAVNGCGAYHLTIKAATSERVVCDPRTKGTVSDIQCKSLQVPG